jgi:hypothetical protein
MKIKTQVFTYGKQSTNGTIISEEVMQDAIDRYMKKPDKVVYMHGEPFLADPKNAYGVVERMTLGDERVMAKIKVISEIPHGKIIKTLIENGADIKFCLQGNVEYSGLKVNAINITNIEPEHEN